MQVVEKEKKLSKSLLWQLQYNAYTQFGPKAWSEKGVPFYVTSNPYTAYSYAQIVFNFLKDSNLKQDQPLYILDLGAGTGRFAYLFLKEFTKLIKHSALQHLSFRYVLTDIVPENFTFWLQHPLLKNFFEQGILDYCFYHHSTANENLNLEYSKVPLVTENPLVLIANYFFDTIPQDLFRISKGKIEEGFVTLYSAKEYSDFEDPAIINDLSWECTFFPENNSYESFPQYKNLLRDYEKLENATLLFPIGALQTLEYFKKLSKSNMLLVAGDQGKATIEQIKEWEPKLSLHGSFSLAVSYHTLAKYFINASGHAFLSSLPDPAFVIMVGLFSAEKRTYDETNYAFTSFVDSFEPQDYWRLGIELEKFKISLEAILLLIKLGRFDPMNFYAFYHSIRQELPFASKNLKKRLSFTIDKVAEHFFPIAQSDGVFLSNLGVLAFELGDYQQALTLFERALSIEGSREYLINNIKACEMRLKR